jgi:Domain of unknown function (DUF6438)
MAYEQDRPDPRTSDSKAPASRTRRVLIGVIVVAGVSIMAFELVSLTRLWSEWTATRPAAPPVAFAPVVLPIPTITASDTDASEIEAKPFAPASPDASSSSAAASEDAGRSPEPPAKASLQRVECYGFCPAYTVSITADGTVTYVGKAFVRVHGKRVKHVDPERAQALVDHFVSAQFFGFKDRYALGVTDMPTATVTFSAGGRTKQVEDYPPCHSGGLGAAAPPADLCALEQEIDQLAGLDEWTRCHDDAENYCHSP